MKSLLRASSLALLASLCACSGREPRGPVVAADAADPQVFGQVPPFALTSQAGEEVTLETFRGRPFAVAAIFTRCAGPCPRITAAMRALSEELAGTDVRLVSVSVDPEYDTPAVLAAYAASYTADTSRWTFLTGSESSVQALLKDGLWLPLARAEDRPPGERVTHSTKVVVIDGDGAIRGWYDALLDEELARLGDRLRWLAGASVERSRLPAVNASLNATAAVLLCVGLFLIKRGRREAHARVMVAATAVSALFLACYLTYHFVVVPEVGHTPFHGRGMLRTAYYAMLISHVLLAIVNLPMILLTLWWARKHDWARHRRMARWTWPVWFYVSVTGVLVYLALYRWNPAAASAGG